MPSNIDLSTDLSSKIKELAKSSDLSKRQIRIKLNFKNIPDILGKIEKKSTLRAIEI